MVHPQRMRGRAGILCKRSADGRAVVTTPRSGRHCRWPMARTRRPSITCHGRVEWPRCSCARRSRVDDTIIGLAAGHSGHAHPPACVPPAPSAPPSQVPCRRRARRSLVLVPVASPMVLPGIPDGFPETAHSVHAHRSRVEETDRIPAADKGSRAHPPTPTASAPRAPASGPPSP